MMDIVRKDMKRKAEDPLRPSSYRLRGRSVPEHKIERFKKDRNIVYGTATTIDAGEYSPPNSRASNCF